MRRTFSLFLVVIMAMTLMAIGTGTALATHTECHDGFDNDGDGLIDFPADPGCTSIDDLHETGDPAVTPSCRASVVRVENLIGIDLEPFVANPNEVPCTTDKDSLIAPTIIGPVDLVAAHAETDAFPNGGFASATLAGAAVAPGIGVFSAGAAAVAVCSGPGAPFFDGFSLVVGVTGVGGGIILIPSAHQDIPIPLVGMLHLNETILEPNKITVRAVWLESTNPLVDSVVLGEAIADCESAPRTGLRSQRDAGVRRIRR